MDALTYRIIHLAALAALAIGTGGMLAGGKNPKLFAAIQGIGLVIMLISGFGMLAKNHLGFPHFAIMKTVGWVVIGMLPFLFRKFKVPMLACILIVLALVYCMAWLGVMKPALW